MNNNDALREAAIWLHAAYDRPPQTPECIAMLAKVDSALLAADKAGVESITKDDILRMALTAGGELSCVAEPLEHPWKFSESELIRFASLIALSERERSETNPQPSALPDDVVKDTDREKVLRILSVASSIIGNLPQLPGYNGSVLTIDDVEAERIANDLDKAAAMLKEGK